VLRLLGAESAVSGLGFTHGGRGYSQALKTLGREFVGTVTGKADDKKSLCRERRQVR